MRISTLTAVFASTMLFGPSNTNAYSPDYAHKAKQIECIAKAVYHEARGEPKIGQIAVAYSVINRRDDPRFPSTSCGVVFQPKQYSHIDKAKFDLSSREWNRAVDVAANVYFKKVSDPTNGARWYYNPDKAKPYWRKYAEGNAVTIGNHKFIENVRNK